MKRYCIARRVCIDLFVMLVVLMGLLISPSASAVPCPPESSNSESSSLQPGERFDQCDPSPLPDPTPPDPSASTSRDRISQEEGTAGTLGTSPEAKSVSQP